MGLAISTGPAAADDYDAVRDALENADYATAYDLLARMGDAGDTLAMVLMADLQLSDYNRSDLGLAIAWLEEAADKGSEHAMLQLGAIYQQFGFLLFPDREFSPSNAAGYPEAVAWYGRAADAGSVEALYRLGSLYRLRLMSMNDPSMSPDDEDRLAADFLQRAADAGHVGAMTLRAMQVRRDDQQRAAALITEAARLGDPQALGMIAAKPDFVGIEDPVEAVAWAIAARDAWALDPNPHSPLFIMIGVDTGAQFTAAMNGIIAEATPEVRAAAQARADEITAGWTSLLPGRSPGNDGGESGGGSFFGRN